MLHQDEPVDYLGGGLAGDGDGFRADEGFVARGRLSLYPDEVALAGNGGIGYWYRRQIVGVVLAQVVSLDPAADLRGCTPDELNYLLASCHRPASGVLLVMERRFARDEPPRRFEVSLAFANEVRANLFARRLAVAYGLRLYTRWPGAEVEEPR